FAFLSEHENLHLCLLLFGSDPPLWPSLLIHTSNDRCHFRHEMCIVSPGNVSPVRMKIGIRSVSAPTRSFLSRGGLIGVMLLAVFLLGHPAAAPQHELLAQSASFIRLPISDALPQRIPRRLSQQWLPPSAPPRATAAL